MAVYQREPLVIIHVRLGFSINHPMRAERGTPIYGNPHVWIFMELECHMFCSSWLYNLFLMAWERVLPAIHREDSTNLRWIFVSSTCSKKKICARWTTQKLKLRLSSKSLPDSSCIIVSCHGPLRGRQQKLGKSARWELLVSPVSGGLPVFVWFMYNVYI